jgi:hypothetical protein
MGKLKTRPCAEKSECNSSAECYQLQDYSAGTEMYTLIYKTIKIVNLK